MTNPAFGLVGTLHSRSRDSRFSREVLLKLVNSVPEPHPTPPTPRRSMRTCIVATDVSNVRSVMDSDSGLTMMCAQWLHGHDRDVANFCQMVLQHDGNELSINIARRSSVIQRKVQGSRHTTGQVATIPCGTTLRTVDEERITVFRLA